MSMTLTFCRFSDMCWWRCSKCNSAMSAIGRTVAVLVYEWHLASTGSSVPEYAHSTRDAVGVSKPALHALVKLFRGSHLDVGTPHLVSVFVHAWFRAFLQSLCLLGFKTDACSSKSWLIICWVQKWNLERTKSWLVFIRP